MLLEITGSRKAHQRREVLRGVRVAAAPGQVLGLVGANGAGKATLITVVAGLRRADGRSVRVGGVDALAHRGGRRPTSVWRRRNSASTRP